MYPSDKTLKCLTSLVNKLAARKWWHLNVIPLGSCFFNLFSHWILQDSLCVAARLSESECNELLASKRRSYGMKRYDRTRWDPVGMTGWPVYPTSPKRWVVNGHKQEILAETMCRLIWSKTSSLEVFIWLEVGASLSGYVIRMSLNGFRLESWHWGRMMRKCKRDCLYSSRFQHRCEGVDGSPLPAPHSHRFIAVWDDSPQDKDEITIWSFKYANIYIYIYRYYTSIAYNCRSWIHCNATCCNEESTAALHACFDFSTSSWLCSKGWGAFDGACGLKPLKTRQQRLVDACFCEIMA